MSVHIDLRGLKYLSAYLPPDEKPLTVKTREVMTLWPRMAHCLILEAMSSDVIKALSCEKETLIAEYFYMFSVSTERLRVEVGEAS